LGEADTWQQGVTRYLKELVLEKEIIYEAVHHILAMVSDAYVRRGMCSDLEHRFDMTRQAIPHEREWYDAYRKTDTLYHMMQFLSRSWNEIHRYYGNMMYERLRYAFLDNAQCYVVEHRTDGTISSTTRTMLPELALHIRSYMPLENFENITWPEPCTSSVAHS
jgi:hypothetical protein